VNPDALCESCSLGSLAKAQGGKEKKRRASGYKVLTHDPKETKFLEEGEPEFSKH